MELLEEERIVHQYKTCSSSSTVLVRGNGRLFIRKFSPGHQSSKLRAQAQWLEDHARLPFVPRVLSAGEVPAGFYFLDLEYIGDSVPFLQFAAEARPEHVERIFGLFIMKVMLELHRSGAPRIDGHKLDRYIDEKFIGKLSQTIRIRPEIERIFHSPVIRINGIEYHNVLPCLARIRHSDKHRRIASIVRASPLHGDLTVDNLLVSRGEIFLLDPNGENGLNTPMVDFAKMLQSVEAGYETMDDAHEYISERGDISFRHEIPAIYDVLNRRLLDILRGAYSADELRGLDFHLAAHFARMLPYKAQRAEGNFWIYYSQIVKSLNRYLES